MLRNIVINGDPMRIMHLSRATLMIRQFMIPVIKAQQKRGHYVCVCGSDDSDVQTLRDEGIDVYPHRLKRSLNPFAVIREIFRIKRILIEQEIDVLVCHSPIGAGVGRLAARLAKTSTVVYFVHGFPCAPSQNIIKWLMWFSIERILGRLTDAVIVMNNYDEILCKTHNLVKDTNKVLRVPGMGVDLDKFSTVGVQGQAQSIRQELAIPKNTTMILSVAYLIREKGVFVFLEAARRICAERSDICFLIAGSGPSMAELKRIVDLNHLENNFKLLGWRTDIYDLMRAADVFVLPTYYFEGLPVSILEAMACGKPVIATKHRGCEDVVVDYKTGYLVPIKQAAPLVEKMVQLADDANLRMLMGQAGRQRVEQSFESNYCIEKILEAIEISCEK